MEYMLSANRLCNHYVAQFTEPGRLYLLRSNEQPLACWWRPLDQMWPSGAAGARARARANEGPRGRQLGRSGCK